MEKKDWKKKLRELSFMKGYYFKLEDNGLVEKKDDRLVFNREELERFVQQELDKAREEGRVEERDRIFWELDGINCVDEALPKNYSAAGMQFGINRVKEIVLQEELSKLTDNK